jgi:putative ABC transport system permease protein
MEALWQDLRYAARTVRKNLGFVLVVVLTLALGIGANTAIFTVVNSVLLRPLPYPHPERLVGLWEKDKDGGQDNATFATFTDWKIRSHTLENISVMSYWVATLAGGSHPERVEGLRVTSDFFRVLGVKPALGRIFLPEEDRTGNHHVVMLSYGLWQSQFSGNPEVVGKQVPINGVSYLVTGVLPRDFESVFSPESFKPAEIWGSLGYNLMQSWACRTCHHLRAIARIKDGVTLEQVRSEMNAISHNLFLEYPKEYAAEGVIVTPLQEEVVGKVRPALLALLGAVGFVLLIACANVASLLLGQAVIRRREVAIRAALGCGRVRLFRQLLTESILLALLGGTAGIAVADWAVNVLVSLAPGHLPRLDQIQLDGSVLGYTLAICLLTGAIFGLAPAWQAFRLDSNESLQEGCRQVAGTDRNLLRGGLVICNVALAIVLLAGAGLMLRSVRRLLDVDPGFDGHHLLTLQLNVRSEPYREDVPCKEGPCLAVQYFYQLALERIQSIRGVASAALVSQLPLGGNLDMYGMHPEGKVAPNPEDDPSADRYGISLGYLRTMRIPLLRGRAFSEQDGPDSPAVVLINETFARRVWGNEDPLGKRIQMGGYGPSEGPWRTVVGIVGDVRHKGLDAPRTLQVYLPQSQWLDSGSTLVVWASGDAASLAGAVRDAIWSVDKNQPITNVATMDQVVARSMADRRFTMMLFSAFSVLALMLAAVGLYGVLAFRVNARTNEIGVRMALGAKREDIFRLVVGQGFFLTSMGIVAGIAGALGLTRFLESQLFGVTPTDPMTFAGVSALLAGVALAACYIPARRATRVDPMVALRYE